MVCVSLYPGVGRGLAMGDGQSRLHHGGAIGNIKNPLVHRGLLRKLLLRLRLKPGTPLYDEAEGEAIVAMVRSIEKHDERKGQFNTYAGRAAYNAMLNVIERHQRSLDAIRHKAESLISSRGCSDTTRAIELMYSCIDYLDELDREIILGVIDGESLKDLSQRVGLSYDATKSRYYKALGALRLLMTRHDCGELEGVVY